jgi:hypothetical protein
MAKGKKKVTARATRRTEPHLQPRPSIARAAYWRKLNSLYPPRCRFAAHSARRRQFSHYPKMISLARCVSMYSRTRLIRPSFSSNNKQ